MRTSITKIKISIHEKISSHHFRSFMLKTFPNTQLAELSKSTGDRKIIIPLLQYKVIDNEPFIFAMEDGIDALNEILPELKQLYLGHQKYDIIELTGEESDQKVGFVLKRKRYDFETPWIALGEEDYGKFKYLYGDERVGMLSNMLVRNILGLARAFDLEVDGRIKVKHDLKEIPPFKLGHATPGFVGKFETNFILPEHFGLGYLSDRGFGSVVTQKS